MSIKKDRGLIGALVIFISVIVGACVYRTERPAPTVESPPVMESPGEEVSKESIPLKPESDKECYDDPKEALDKFLTYLHTGQYEKAARLYRGNQEPFLAYSNRDQAEPIKILTEHFKNFCEGYGTCLKHKIVEEEVVSQDETLYTVVFLKDGNPLSFRVPVEGKEGDLRYETRGPNFEFLMNKFDGCYRSLSHPPITP